jgi:hypothetical protein
VKLQWVDRNTTVAGVCTVCAIDVDEAFDKIRSSLKLTIPEKIDVSKYIIVSC